MDPETVRGMIMLVSGLLFLMLFLYWQIMIVRAVASVPKIESQLVALTALVEKLLREIRQARTASDTDSAGTRCPHCGTILPDHLLSLARFKCPECKTVLNSNH